ncbi:MAG: glycosyltransferase [Thermoplasmata archaeon]|nr:glycosyltransferase [Thermoplasmata archaeon]
MALLADSPAFEVGSEVALEQSPEVDAMSAVGYSPVDAWRVLVGGIFAFNEEERLPAAVESLLIQELPTGVRWGSIWIVTSGSTDRTAQVARALAAADSRLWVLEEPERRGKSAAIAGVLDRADGDYLLLLNADARAEPGSAAALLARAAPLEPPFAVMGRPLPPASEGAFASAIELLWELHHELHQFALTRGEGTHLSDELLLVSLATPPPLSAGIVNDGAFVGAWLSTHAGSLRYSPSAGVRIEVPTRWREHLLQRRRIHFGHRQVSRLVGVAPTTLPSLLLRRPRSALRLLRRAVRKRPDGVRSLTLLAAAELAAVGLSSYDQLRSRDHVLWRRIREVPEPPHRSTSAART